MAIGVAREMPATVAETVVAGDEPSNTDTRWESPRATPSDRAKPQSSPVSWLTRNRLAGYDRRIPAVDDCEAETDSIVDEAVAVV